jgi:hypothetical protein
MSEHPFIAKASWEPKDDDQLRALAALGKGVATIADLLGLSPTAVRGRAFKLGLILGRVAKRN